MNRTGLLIALGVGIVAGLIFGLFPQHRSCALAPFLRRRPSRRFCSRAIRPRSRFATEFVYVITAIAAPAFIALAVKLILPRRRMLIPGRAVVFLIATLALAPGLVANVDPEGQLGPAAAHSVQRVCRAGAPSSRGGTRAAAATRTARSSRARARAPSGPSRRPRSRRRRGARSPMGPRSPSVPVSAASALAFGAHFLSDVIFAGVFTFLVIWLRPRPDLPLGRDAPDRRAGRARDRTPRAAGL